MANCWMLFHDGLEPFEAELEVLELFGAPRGGYSLVVEERVEAWTETWLLATDLAWRLRLDTP